MTYNSYLTRRLIHQGQHARVDDDGARALPRAQPPPLCRGQIWVIRSIDEDCHIQVLNETIHLPAR